MASGMQYAAPPGLSGRCRTLSRRSTGLSDHERRSDAADAPRRERRGDGRGATLALRCTMHHGARGLSQADSRTSPGRCRDGLQAAGGLQNRRTPQRGDGALSSATSATQTCAILPPITPFCRALSGEQTGAGAAPRIVASGAPMRGIAPCGACHGELDSKAGAAWLEGQPLVYLRSQLEAFLMGARRNDIGAQMRNVARAIPPRDRCRKPVLRGPAVRLLR